MEDTFFRSVQDAVAAFSDLRSALWNVSWEMKVMATERPLPREISTRLHTLRTFLRQNPETAQGVDSISLIESVFSELLVAGLDLEDTLRLWNSLEGHRIDNRDLLLLWMVKHRDALKQWRNVVDLWAYASRQPLVKGYSVHARPDVAGFKLVQPYSGNRNLPYVAPTWSISMNPASFPTDNSVLPKFVAPKEGPDPSKILMSGSSADYKPTLAEWEAAEEAECELDAGRSACDACVRREYGSTCNIVNQNPCNNCRGLEELLAKRALAAAGAGVVYVYKYCAAPFSDESAAERS